MPSDEDQVSAESSPDWEFRFGMGEPAPAALTEAQRRRLTQLQELLPETGHAAPAQHLEDLTKGLRALIDEGVSVDVLAVELRLPRTVVEAAADR
ncbi:hypothetical protein [Pseudoclavibacter sp. JSM 162008]|uniref:hypothetical protein n=1 Tax=Pseudoclavibacter sp. JSM 162008 TaxID=3229855 RepID=UPI003526BC7F